MMFYARHLTFYKKPFYVFFQNAHHCNLKKMLYLRIFGGLSVSMLELSLMFAYLLKVGCCLEAV